MYYRITTWVKRFVSNMNRKLKCEGVIKTPTLNKYNLKEADIKSIKEYQFLKKHLVRLENL